MPDRAHPGLWRPRTAGWGDASRMQARSLAEADPRMTLAHAAPDQAHRGHHIAMVCENMWRAARFSNRSTPTVGMLEFEPS